MNCSRLPWNTSTLHQLLWRWCIPSPTQCGCADICRQERSRSDPVHRRLDLECGTHPGESVCPGASPGSTDEQPAQKESHIRSTLNVSYYSNKDHLMHGNFPNKYRLLPHICKKVLHIQTHRESGIMLCLITQEDSQSVQHSTGLEWTASALESPDLANLNMCIWRKGTATSAHCSPDTLSTYPRTWGK